MIWGVVLIITLTVFFAGKSKNDALAQKWKKSVNEIITSNFAHFGFQTEPSTSLEYDY